LPAFRRAINRTQTFTVVRKSPAVPRTPAVKKPSSGKYYALVIGNNDYEYIPKLETAKKDARRVSAALADRYGFETKLLLDASRNDILRAFSKLWTVRLGNSPCQAGL